MYLCPNPNCLYRGSHNNVFKWKHFPRFWSSVRGIHWSPVNSPHESKWRGALMFSLICVWINAWVNNREADDLRRNCAHYDVIAMINRCKEQFSPLFELTIRSCNFQIEFYSLLIDPIKTTLSEINCLIHIQHLVLMPGRLYWILIELFKTYFTPGLVPRRFYWIYKELINGGVIRVSNCAHKNIIYCNNLAQVWVSSFWYSIQLCET